jgi:hypothetical protein
MGPLHAAPHRDRRRRSAAPAHGVAPAADPAAGAPAAARSLGGAGGVHPHARAAPHRRGDRAARGRAHWQPSHLRSVLDDLHEHNLLHFKGATDELERTDALQVLSYAYQYMALHDLRTPAVMSLRVVAPTLTPRFRAQLTALGGALVETEVRGVHVGHLQGFALRVVETSVAWSTPGEHLLFAISPRASPRPTRPRGFDDTERDAVLPSPAGHHTTRAGSHAGGHHEGRNPRRRDRQSGPHGPPRRAPARAETRGHRRRRTLRAPARAATRGPRPDSRARTRDSRGSHPSSDSRASRPSSASRGSRPSSASRASPKPTTCSRSPTRPSARSPRTTSRPSPPTRKPASARASAADPTRPSIRDFVSPHSHRAALSREATER